MTVVCSVPVEIVRIVEELFTVSFIYSFARFNVDVRGFNLVKNFLGKFAVLLTGITSEKQIVKYVQL